MVIPFQMVMFTLSKTADSLKLTTPWGILIIYLGFGAGLAVFMFSGFVKSIPVEIEEAADVDGAGPLTVLLKIYLPVSLPALATVALFAIVNHWNDYFSGLIYMSKAEMYPLQTYIQQLTVDLTQITDANQLKQLASMNNRTFNAAKIVVSTIPLLIIYLFLQKYFVTGMVIGAVKE